jgi:hypothetical protein
MSDPIHFILHKGRPLPSINSPNSPPKLWDMYISQSTYIYSNLLMVSFRVVVANTAIGFSCRHTCVFLNQVLNAL